MDSVRARSRNTAAYWIGGILLVIALAALVLVIVAARISPIVRAKAIEALEKRYQSKVELGSLSVNLLPRVSVTGQGLELRKVDRLADPPMITIRRFVARTGFLALVGKPLHIRYLRLEGLKLELPHKKSDDEKSKEPPKSAPKGSEILVIDEIDADGTFLRVLPKDPKKNPLDFDITKLTLHSAGKDEAMRFKATLTNPKPPGLVESTGHFGPWQSGEPGDTPLNGHYTFNHADLSVFKGIAGYLSSVGDYQGQLNRIDVRGTTDTPDFALTTGNPLHLKADFEATVDGTDGDTYLHPVKAKFLSSSLVCQGKVEHKPGGPPGKTVALDVAMTNGRIEDLLRLAVKGDPILQGQTQFHAKFLLPPGKSEVMDRLQLDGTFGIARARFTRNAVEEKITDLSLRAQGRTGEAKQQNVGPGATAPESVASDLQARFGLKDGSATFSELFFQLPGAQLSLAGSYGLAKEELDFRGKLRMDAKVSQAFTGWKSLLLKAADPFFSKHGHGAEVPLTISGTRKDPKFGLQLFHKENNKAAEPQAVRR